jgi:prepilin-type N-terminal cleavage/methylation domain-containing protein
MSNVRERGYSLIEVMVVVGLIGIVSAMVVPITETSLKSSRLKRDADSVRHLVGLAKMRASSQFTRSRVMVDLGANTFILQIGDRTNNVWVNDGGLNATSTGVTFGFGTLAAAPPNTQVNIEMSPPCTDGINPAGNVIANTACVYFNSRGLPVDSAGALYPRHALYLRGETGVFATTVTSTPLIRFWWSPRNNAVWTEK